jgi:hypothetical protein
MDMAKSKKQKTKKTSKSKESVKEKIHKFLQTKKNWLLGRIVKIKKQLVFLIYLTRLRFLNSFRYTISFFFQRWGGLIVSLLYFIFLVVVLRIFDSLISPHFTNSDAITFFTAAGAMVGGILAIIFSLRIFLMDKAERIPVGFYEIASKDRTHDLIYVLISLCSLFLFSFAVAHGTLHLGLSKFSLEAALFLMGTAFYLVFLLDKRVRDRLNPNAVLLDVRKYALKELDKVKKRAVELANVLEKDPALDGDVAKEAILAKSYQYLKPNINKINASLNYLYDYHDRLVANREHSSAQAVLETIEIVLLRYFEARKESSVVLPSGLLLTTTSDSREFLTPVLERLLSVGEEYMRSNDNPGITKVIHIFRDLCVMASEIKYVTGRSSENPILEQCRGYLGQLMDSAVKLKHLEALFQGAIVYKDLGIIAVNKNLYHEFSPVFDTLEKIAISGLVNQQEVVLSEAVNSYNGILASLILANRFDKIKLKSLLEKVENVIYLAYISVSSGTLRGNYLTQTTLATPFETIRDCVFELVRKVEEKDRLEDMRHLKSAFFDVVEETRRTLRSLSEKMKNADHLLITTFSSVVSDIGELMLDLTANPKWNPEKRELENQTKWYIHQTTWFTHEVPKINSNLSFDSLVEAATKIGLHSLQVGNEEIAIEAEKIIKGFAISMLEKEAGDTRFGFTEPRIMERACFVGILAKKLGKTAVVTALKPMITEFETAYRDLYFRDDRQSNTPPTRDQLMSELFQLADDASEYRDLLMSRMMDDSRQRLLALVNKADIEEFIFEIWGVRATD